SFSNFLNCRNRSRREGYCRINLVCRLLLEEKNRLGLDPLVCRTVGFRRPLFKSQEGIAHAAGRTHTERTLSEMRFEFLRKLLGHCTRKVALEVALAVVPCTRCFRIRWRHRTPPAVFASLNELLHFVSIYFRELRKSQAILNILFIDIATDAVFQYPTKRRYLPKVHR